MSYEEPKCGDECKLVELMMTKTSKSQAMENAIAAVNTGKMSAYKAAIVFRVTKSHLQKKLKNALTGTGPNEAEGATQSESAPAKPKAADKAERDQWFADYQAGLSARKIAEKFGRSRLSVTKEIKRREEAEGQSEPTPTPETTPTPSAQPASTPEPEQSPIPSKNHEILKDWNGQLAEHHQKIIKREKPRNRKIQKVIPVLAEIKDQIEKTMKAASKDSQNYGAGFLGMYIVVVEEQLRQDNEPGIKQSLEEIMHEAERIQKFASESLRMLRLEDS